SIPSVVVGWHIPTIAIGRSHRAQRLPGHAAATDRVIKQNPPDLRIVVTYLSIGFSFVVLHRDVGRFAIQERLLLQRPGQLVRPPLAWDQYRVRAFRKGYPHRVPFSFASLSYKISRTAIPFVPRT